MQVPCTALTIHYIVAPTSPPTQPNPSYLSPYDCVSYLVICGYCKVPSLSKFQAGENIQRPSRSAGRPTLMKTLLYTAPEHRM